MLLIGKAAAFCLANFWEVFIAWNMIIMSTTFFFHIIGLNVGHHGTEVVHEGDEFKSLDFAIHQMAATVERHEVNSNLFMALTYYGEHVLHHFFPTLDHSVLHNFHDELMETCEEFKEDLKRISMVNAAIEQVKHHARTKTIRLKKAE